jgi:hypothetical protein
MGVRSFIIGYLRVFGRAGFNFSDLLDVLSITWLSGSNWTLKNLEVFQPHSWWRYYN